MKTVKTQVKSKTIKSNITTKPKDGVGVHPKMKVPNLSFAKKIDLHGREC